ncbi:hypothetical protein Rsub_10742 [Raphidocelis subcapitata]|uniref:Core domain-containing protein n=1 Tax=Raphidocelis subcapitata TaxID=307507 RepID=A0A2V0PCN7_9CHLO|nr:hypothetical protein Rsub_10742 [Raphidocelis subcapitata]|eukprot:GBF97606.1 hypothetical protein Rsub_10742 [Raphidocelis subcapitata]
MLASRRASAAGAASRATAAPRPVIARVSLKPRHQLVRVSSSAAPATAAELPTQPINLTPTALEHLKKLRAEVGGDELLLRVGGGCSGMSYTMDFTSSDKVSPDDTVLPAGSGPDAEGLRLVCDPKSLLYLFGLTLDFSTELIGGGFKFSNPNATETCGCNNSFSV